MCETWNSAFQRLAGHQHPGDVDAAEMSPEGRGSRLYTDRAGESWDAAAQASEARVHRSAGAPEVLVQRSRSRNEDGRGDVGRCRSSDPILDSWFVVLVG